MKVEKFSIKDKTEIFQKLDPMHDCRFTATFGNNKLVLVYDNLEQYYDGPPISMWYENYKRVTVIYHTKDSIDLQLKCGKKEKSFYDTVTPLNDKELIMYKFSIDCFDKMMLDFDVLVKKKFWGGKIEIYPDEIEYIWE